MGTIAQKLNYSLEAKELIKDGINYLGGNVTDETTLKEYRDELDSVYNKLPKVSNSTASDNVILYPTLKGKIDSTLNGQIGQEGNPSLENEIPVKSVTGENTVRVRGKNLFDKDNITDNAGYTGNVNDTLSTNTNASTFIAPLITSNNGNITISSNKTSAIYRVRLIDSNNKILSSTAYTTMPQTIDTRNCDKIAIMFDKTTITIADNIQIEQGSTATDYEPYYEPQEKPLNLGNLEVYEDGYFSRENGKWYLNNAYGEDDIDENYNISYSTAKDDYYIIQIQPKVSIKNEKRMYCNLFKYIENGWNVNEENIGYGGSNLNLIQFKILGSRLSELTATSARKFLSDANTKVLSYLQTPSKVEITNQTLINQLNDIYKLMSYDGTTIIETECENGNMPIIINASALLDSAKVIEDLETRIEVLESEE